MALLAIDDEVRSGAFEMQGVVTDEPEVRPCFAAEGEASSSPLLDVKGTRTSPECLEP